MTTLPGLGWGPALAASFDALGHPDLSVARVCAEHRGQLELIDPDGTFVGQPRGALYASGTVAAVGDWVAVRRIPDGPAIIHDVLERRSAFVRRAAGRASVAQVIAANIDTVFVVTSLDRDFQPRRVERYLAVVTQSGARGVVVLTKADLVEDVAPYVDQLHHEAIVALSAQTGSGLDQLAPWLQPGQTVALVGSSGVGKSTLVNALLQTDAQAVSAVRGDGRGQHTTTTRQLLVMPGGALLIDTPGMREMQLWDGDLDEVFDDLAELATRCGFRDCRHIDEPGCAVLAAVEDGTLEPGRLANYRKLQRELAHERRRHDARAQKTYAKNHARMIKEVKAMRRATGRRREYED